MGEREKESAERELQKIALEMNYYRAQAEDLRAQINALHALVQENDSAKESLKSLQEMGEKSETLFPIGGGVLLRATPSSQKVLVEVGAKVIADKTIGEAIQILEERKERVVKTLSAMQDSLQELNSRMIALSEKAERLQK